MSSMPQDHEITDPSTKSCYSYELVFIRVLIWIGNKLTLLSSTENYCLLQTELSIPDGGVIVSLRMSYYAR